MGGVVSSTVKKQLFAKSFYAAINNGEEANRLFESAVFKGAKRVLLTRVLFGASYLFVADCFPANVLPVTFDFTPSTFYPGGVRKFLTFCSAKNVIRAYPANVPMRGNHALSAKNLIARNRRQRTCSSLCWSLSLDLSTGVDREQTFSEFSEWLRLLTTENGADLSLVVAAISADSVASGVVMWKTLTSSNKSTFVSARTMKRYLGEVVVLSKISTKNGRIAAQRILAQRNFSPRLENTHRRRWRLAATPRGSYVPSGFQRCKITGACVVCDIIRRSSLVSKNTGKTYDASLSPTAINCRTKGAVWCLETPAGNQFVFSSRNEVKRRLNQRVKQIILTNGAISLAVCALYLLQYANAENSLESDKEWWTLELATIRCVDFPLGLNK